MQELNDLLKDAASISVYTEGSKAEYPRGSARYDALADAWKKMTEKAVRMPAFGVSIDKLTREELKKGTWMEFCFDKEQACAGMPFERLLLKVCPDYMGFNAVRCVQGKYEGRCFYVDLRGGNMECLAEEAKRG